MKKGVQLFCLILLLITLMVHITSSQELEKEDTFFITGSTDPFSFFAKPAEIVEEAPIIIEEVEFFDMGKEDTSIKETLEPIPFEASKTERKEYLSQRLKQEEEKRTLVNTKETEQSFFGLVTYLLGFGESQAIEKTYEGIRCPEMNDLKLEEQGMGTSKGTNRNFEEAITAAQADCERKKEYLQKKAAYYQELEAKLCTDLWEPSCTFETETLNGEKTTCKVTQCTEEKAGEKCIYKVINGELQLELCKPEQIFLLKSEGEIECNTKEIYFTQDYNCIEA